MRTLRASLIVFLLVAGLAAPALAAPLGDDDGAPPPRARVKAKVKAKVKPKAKAAPRVAKARPQARPGQLAAARPAPARPVARPAVARAVTEGKPWLGVTLADVTALDRRQRGIPKHGGVVIEDVLAGGPAAKAGFAAGDVIMRLGGEYVYAPAEVVDRVARGRVGGVLKIDIIRNGKWMTADLRLTPRPDKFNPTRGEALASRDDAPVGARPVGGPPARPVAHPAAPGPAPDATARRLESLEKEIRLLRQALVEMKGRCTARAAE
jgi:hypothetical protein